MEVPMPESEEQMPVPKKRIANEKQKEALKKGWDALKAKREVITKAREADPAYEYVKPPPKKPVAKKAVDPAVIVQPAPPRIVKTPSPTKLSIVQKELAELKGLITQNHKPVEVERIVEVPKEVVREVIKEVHIEKVLTGSALLDRYFFNR